MRRVVAAALLAIVLCTGCDKVNGASQQPDQRAPRMNCATENIFFAANGASDTIKC